MTPDEKRNAKKRKQKPLRFNDMDILDIMKNIATDGGTFSEGKLSKLSEITGLSQDELFELYEKGKKPDVPQGDPRKWDIETKLKFISDMREQGKPNAYKELLKERQ